MTNGNSQLAVQVRYDLRNLGCDAIHVCPEISFTSRLWEFVRIDSDYRNGLHVRRWYLIDLPRLARACLE